MNGSSRHHCEFCNEGSWPTHRWPPVWPVQAPGNVLLLESTLIVSHVVKWLLSGFLLGAIHLRSGVKTYSNDVWDEAQSSDSNRWIIRDCPQRCLSQACFGCVSECPQIVCEMKMMYWGIRYTLLVDLPQYWNILVLFWCGDLSNHGILKMMSCFVVSPPQKRLVFGDSHPGC